MADIALQALALARAHLRLLGQLLKEGHGVGPGITKGLGPTEA